MINSAFYIDTMSITGTVWLVLAERIFNLIY